MERVIAGLHETEARVDGMVRMIKEAKEGGHTVFICGNGGSAANAEHFTNDLFSKQVKAVCLNSNTAIMTMIANDFGYDQVFKMQLLLYAEPDDLLIVISCSGNSPNVVEALKVGCKKAGLLGRGGKAKGMVDYSITVEDDDFGVVESIHSTLAHKIAGGI